MRKNGLFFKLPKYSGITFWGTLRKSTAPKAGVPLILGDATGNGDITGTYQGASFPLYGTQCVNGSSQSTTCSGTAFLYLEVINGGTSQVMLAASPAVKVVSWKGFPGATLCFPALLTSKGWLAFTTIGVAPHSKRTLSIPSAKVPFPLPKGPVVLALACE